MVYDMLIPSIPFIGGYLLTYSLYKLNLIKRAVHINIWNMIIGLAFLISGIGGFILLILLEMGFKSPLNQQLLYWHVELGVSMVLISVFHFHTYWKSARKIFISRKRRSNHKA
jgi:hypothetical protein